MTKYKKIIKAAKKQKFPKTMIHENADQKCKSVNILLVKDWQQEKFLF
jgi:hypothetical protein